MKVYVPLSANQGPFADVPVLPDNLRQVSKAWLIRWLEWLKSGKPEVDGFRANSGLAIRVNEFIPALHPRDPETGKFVERPFDIPDGVDSEAFAEMDTPELLQEINDAGGDVEGLLQRDNVTIDGVPVNTDSLEQLGGTETPTPDTLSVNRVDSTDPEDLAEAVPTMNSYAEESLPEVPSNILEEDEIEDVRAAHAEMFSRAPQEVAETVINGTVAVASTNDPLRGQHGDVGHFELGEDGSLIQVPNGDGRNITIHETAHAIHTRFGYETDKYTTGNKHFVDYNDSEVRDYMLQTPDGTPVGASEWFEDITEEVGDFTPGETDASSNNQDVIGTPTGDTVREQMQSLVNATNRAFLKQQKALSEYDQDGAREMVIKTGYSMKAANETFTQLHEVMNLENSASAIGEVGKLVDHHPELLNAYLNIYDPSPTVQEELERRGVL